MLRSLHSRGSSASLRSGASRLEPRRRHGEGTRARAFYASFTNHLAHFRLIEHTLRTQARARAKDIADQYEGIAGAEYITVADHAHVQPCEGGAFVEAIIWVPDAQIASGTRG